jgi:hypothetical protein
MSASFSFKREREKWQRIEHAKIWRSIALLEINKRVSVCGREKERERERGERERRETEVKFYNKNAAMKGAGMQRYTVD